MRHSSPIGLIRPGDGSIIDIPVIIRVEGHHGGNIPAAQPPSLRLTPDIDGVQWIEAPFWGSRGFFALAIDGDRVERATEEPQIFDHVPEQRDERVDAPVADEDDAGFANYFAAEGVKGWFEDIGLVRGVPDRVGVKDVEVIPLGPLPGKVGGHKPGIASAFIRDECLVHGVIEEARSDFNGKIQGKPFGTSLTEERWRDHLRTKRTNE